MAGGRIDYTIGFRVDNTALNSLKTQLQQLTTTINSFSQNKNGEGFIGNQKVKMTQSEIASIKTSISEMEAMLTSSFNTQLGTLNVAKFNQQLQSSKIPLSQIQADFAKMGAEGQNAFRSIAAQAMSTNMQLKQSHTFLNSMADTMVNTFKWGIASSALNTMTGSVKKAYSYVKQLDSSINNIRIVTGKSADEMERFATQANKAAKNLGASTTAYTDAALIYYQQGDSDAVAQAKAEVTLKTANVTGQSADEVSEQLTAVWNGYKVDAAEAESYIDKLAAVAATTASDLEELSTGMSKVASAANLMGVDIDQLNASLATVIAVTREAPETIGTSFKTIFARIGDIEAGLDDEATLGEYSGAMAELGFNVLDANGNLRDMGEVIEEIGGNWQNLSKEQQVSLAHTMAGTRQYSRLLALFDNWGMYEEAIKTSADATGTLQSQQDIYMDSMEAHLKQLKAAGEDVYDSLMNPDGMNTVIDVLTSIVDTFGNFIDAIGGGSGALLLLGQIAMNVFHKNIVNGLTTMITNMQIAKDNAAQVAAETEMIKFYDSQDTGQDARYTQLIKMKKTVLEFSKTITNEERETLSQMMQQTDELYKQQDALETKTKEMQDYLSMRTGDNYDLSKSEDTVDEKGKVIAYGTKSAMEHVDAIDKGLSDQEGDLKVLEDAEKELTVAQTDLGKATTDEAKAEATKRLAEAKQQLADAEKQAQEAMQKANEQGLISITVQDKIAEIDTEISQLEASKHKHHKLTKKQQEENLAIEQKIQNARKKQTDIYRKDLKDQRKQLKQTKKELNGHSVAVKENKEAIKNAGSAFDKFKEKLKLEKTVTGVVNFTRGLNQSVMAINSLVSAWNTLQDPDASSWEKISTVIMSLSMAMPGIITMFGGLGKAVNFVTGGYKKLNAEKTVGTAVSKVSEIQTEKETGTVVKKVTADKAEELSEKGKTKEKTKGIFAKLLSKKGTEGETGSTIKDTIANWANVASQAAKFWYVSLIIVAITALIRLIIALTGAEESEAEQLKKANADRDEAKNKYNELTEAANNFKEAVSNYDDGIKALKDLEKGTEEYQKKLEEVNAQAKELIETYGLYGKFKYGSMGEIIIDQDALNAAKAELEESANKARQGYLAASIRANDAQAAYDADVEGNRVDGLTHNLDAEEMLKVTKAINDFSREIEEAENTTDAVNLGSDELVQKLKNSAEKYGIASDTIGDLSSTIKKEGVSSIYKLAESIEKVEDASLEYAREILGLIVSDEYSDMLNRLATNPETGEVDEAKKTQMQQALGAITQSVEIDGLNADEWINKKTSEAYKKIDDKVSSWDAGNDMEGYLQDFAKDIGTDVNAMSQEAFGQDYSGNVQTYTMLKKILEGQGYTNVTTSDDNGEVGYSYTDKEGNLVTDKSMSNEAVQKLFGKTMIDAGLRIAVKEAVGSQASESDMEELFEKTNKATNIYGADWSSALLSGIANKGDFDFSSVFAELNPQDIAALKDMDAQQLMELFGYDENDLKTAGFETLEAFKSAIDQGLESYTVEPLIENYKAKIEKVNEALESLYEGDELDKELVSELEAKYAGLANIKDKNSKEYLRALEAIKQQEEENLILANLYATNEGYIEAVKAIEEMDSALQDFNNHAIGEEFWDEELGKFITYSEVAIDNIEKMGSTLEAVFNADYKLQESLTDNLLSDVDDAIGKAKHAQIALGAIGNGFKVAASDSEELFKVFPELAESATILADGTVQLNQQVANEVLGSQGELIAMDKYKTAENIKNRITELDTQIANDEAMLKSIVEDGMTTDELNELIKSRKIEGLEETEDTTLKTAETELKADGAVTKGVVENWATKEEAAINYAKTVGNIPEMVKTGVYKSLIDSEDILVNSTLNIDIDDEDSNKSDTEKEYDKLQEKARLLLAKSIESKKQQRAQLVQALSQLNYETTTALQKAAQESQLDIMDLLDDTVDIYHDINNEIEKLINNLDELQEAQERAVGKDLIDNLNQQLGLLTQQTKSYEKKRVLIEGETAALQALLAAQGATFNEQGDINNYKALLSSKQDRINQLIEERNASQDEDRRSVIEKMIDDEQKSLDKLNEYIEKYENNLYNELPNLTKELRETLNSLIELQVEKFTLEVDLAVDLTELKKEWREFEKEILHGEENYIKNASVAMQNLKDIFDENGNGYFKDVLNKMEITQREIEKMQKGEWSDIYGDNEQLARETMLELKDTAMDYASSIQEYIEAIEEAVSGAIENIDDLHNQIMDTLERTLSVIEHQISVIELMGGENVNTIDLLNDKLEVYVKQISNAKDALIHLENAYDLEELKEKDFNAYAEHVAAIGEKQDEILSITEEALTTINDILRKTIELNLKTLETNLTNGSWEDISNKWERDGELAEIFLSSIEKEYELQKLINKLNQDLLKTQYESLEAQKKINNFKQTELDILMQKDKLTEAEVSRANKLYELTLLQIALEEARNNKTSMKLARDSQGNYTYQYQADETAVEKAEQSVADKQNELYQQNIDNIKSSIESFNSAGAAIQDKLSELFEDERFQEYIGLSSSEEGRQSKRFKELEAWLNDSYSTIQKNSKFEMFALQGNAQNALQSLFKDLGMNNIDLNNLTDEQLRILAEEGIDISNLSALTDLTEENFDNEFNAFKGGIDGLVELYNTQVKQTMEASRQKDLQQFYQSTEQIKENTNHIISQFDEELLQNKEDLKFLQKELLPKVDSLEKKFKKFFIDSGEGTFSSIMNNHLEILDQDLKSVTDALVKDENSVKSSIEAASTKVITAVNNITAGDNVEADVNAALGIYRKKINEDAAARAAAEADAEAERTQRELESKGTGNYSVVKTASGEEFMIKSTDVKNKTHTAISLSSGKTKTLNIDDVTDTGRKISSNYLDQYRYAYYDANNNNYLGFSGNEHKTKYHVYAIDSKGNKFIGTNLKDAKWQSDSKYKMLSDAKLSENMVEYQGKKYAVMGVSTAGLAKLKGENGDSTSADITSLTYLGQYDKDYWRDYQKLVPAAKHKIGNRIKTTAGTWTATQIYRFYDDKPSSYGNYAKTEVGQVEVGIIEAKKYYGDTWYYKIKDPKNMQLIGNSYNEDNLWIKGATFKSFGTGGYTGAWFNGSKEGRLAMLHQKELILNETDTPKILDAVKLVREISAGSIIANYQEQMRNTLSSLENQLIGTYTSIEGMAAATKQSTDQMLEQAVHIDASFPGVRDSREIEEALKNLVNVASQYAYIKK